MQTEKLFHTTIFLGMSLLLTAPGHAANEALVLTSAPRESVAKARALYEPIAEYLSKTTGRPFVFKYSDNWLTYQTEMRNDAYDLVFDGPSFVSWRMLKLEHTPILKMPGNLVFAAIARKDNVRVNELKDLAGRTVCGFPSPNLATMTVTYEFDNPARQPLLINTKGFDQIYQGVIQGKCVGGIIQAKLFEEFDKDAQLGKVLFKSKPLPNQAFSTSRRISPDLRQKIMDALTSKAGEQATAKLREEFKGQNFVPATREEYEKHHVLMRDVWGFEIEAVTKDTAVQNATPRKVAQP
jgi:ABC-type phosphate/phosphonate transport system substrate-binding protein